MSEKSPYKEVGIPAMPYPAAKRYKKNTGVYSCHLAAVLPSRHLWGENKSRITSRGKMRTLAFRAGLRTCERCGQPEFSVGHIPCKGAK